MPRFYGGYRRSFRRRSYGSRYGRSYRSRRFSAVRRVARTTAIKTLRRQAPLKTQQGGDGTLSISSSGITPLGLTAAGYPLGIAPLSADPDGLSTSTCHFSGFKLKFQIQSGDSSNFVRILVVEWVDIASSALTMLPNTILQDPPKSDKVNYTVLMDRRVSIKQQNLAGGAVDQSIIIEKYFPYKRTLNYDITGGAVEPDIGTTGRLPRIVRAYAVSDSLVIPHPVVEMAVTRYFRDAPVSSSYDI